MIDSKVKFVDIYFKKQKMLHKKTANYSHLPFFCTDVVKKYGTE